MLIRHFASRFTAKLNQPLRIFSVVFDFYYCRCDLKRASKHYKILCSSWLSHGYFLYLQLTHWLIFPCIFSINSAQARACALEIGIHNSTLTMMASSTVAMPAAVYSIFMYIFAACFAWMLNRLVPIAVPNLNSIKNQK